MPYRIGNVLYEVSDRLTLVKAARKPKEHPPKKSRTGKDMVWNEETKRYRLASKQGDSGKKKSGAGKGDDNKPSGLPFISDSQSRKKTQGKRRSDKKWAGTGAKGGTKPATESGSKGSPSLKPKSKAEDDIAQPSLKDPEGFQFYNDESSRDRTVRVNLLAQMPPSELEDYRSRLQSEINRVSQRDKGDDWGVKPADGDYFKLLSNENSAVKGALIRRETVGWQPSLKKTAGNLVYLQPKRRG